MPGFAGRSYFEDFFLKFLRRGQSLIACGVIKTVVFDVNFRLAGIQNYFEAEDRIFQSFCSIHIGEGKPADDFHSFQFAEIAVSSVVVNNDGDVLAVLRALPSVVKVVVFEAERRLSDPFQIHFTELESAEIKQFVLFPIQGFSREGIDIGGRDLVDAGFSFLLGIPGTVFARPKGENGQVVIGLLDGNRHVRLV